jgi:small multidrug resistance pump
MTGYLWCAVAGLASALATQFIKLSSHHAADWNPVRIAFLGAAGVTYMAGFVTYSFGLQKLDMHLAYPVMTAAAMVMVAALGFAALDEPLTVSKVTGMVLVVLGAFALSR